MTNYSSTSPSIENIPNLESLIKLLDDKKYNEIGITEAVIVLAKEIQALKENVNVNQS